MEKFKENVKVLHAFEYQDLVPGAGKYLKGLKYVIR